MDSLSNKNHNNGSCCCDNLEMKMKIKKNKTFMLFLLKNTILVQEEFLRRRLQQIIYYPNCAIDKGTIILLPLERLFKFVMSGKSLIN